MIRKSATSWCYLDPVAGMSVSTWVAIRGMGEMPASPSWAATRAEEAPVQQEPYPKEKSPSLPHTRLRVTASFPQPYLMDREDQKIMLQIFALASLLNLAAGNVANLIGLTVISMPEPTQGLILSSNLCKDDFPADSGPIQVMDLSLNPRSHAGAQPKSTSLPISQALSSTPGRDHGRTREPGWTRGAGTEPSWIIQLDNPPMSDRKVMRPGIENYVAPYPIGQPDYDDDSQ